MLSKSRTKEHLYLWQRADPGPTERRQTHENPERLSFTGSNPVSPSDHHSGPRSSLVIPAMKLANFFWVKVAYWPGFRFVV